MAMSDNYVMLKFNALKNDQQQELLFGIKSPGESITMDGQAPATAWFFPRPTSKNQFEPFSVEVPPCFSVHFSHSYEDPDTGNFVTYFAGWPPSDRTDLLGAWSGYCPKFRDIPPTFLWRLEVDVNMRKTVSLNVAPGSANACLEFPMVHPSVGTSKAENVYALVSNVIGDSTAPNGYCRLEVEKGSREALPTGTKNEDIDAYWFGSRYFTGEPLIVPKKGGDLKDEKDAYLIGMVKDSAEDRSFLAVFDLQRELKEGPVCKVWTKGSIPHGLHGCFAENDSGASSVFC
jgi:carotenoid cleavage dioxygenase-like enzyme